MKTPIGRSRDPRQQTGYKTTSNKGKEIEMKTRMNSKRTIIGLGIGIGLIAGLSVMLSGAQTRAFNPTEATGNVAAHLIDASQELGSYDTQLR